MRVRRALALGAAALTATGVVLTASQPAQAAPTVSLASTIALSDCSASLVRYPGSRRTDQAMMLTNGHCYEGGFIGAGKVLRNVRSDRTGTLLNRDGHALGTVRADRVLYATMTGTDVTLYRLTSTYATLQRRYGSTALTIAAKRPRAGASIAIPSGYWKQTWSCKTDRIVGTLREDRWTWHDSIRYDDTCNPTHGTSGSPIIDTSSGQIVGINNTGNDDGEMCTLNNPCEVEPDGTTHAYRGQTYGEETYWFTTCLTGRRRIDLGVPGCLLPKPTAAPSSAGH
jgi:hypothetical protein